MARRLLNITFIAAVYFFLASPARGQVEAQEQFFSGDLRGLSFDQLVTLVEKESSYRIFYNKAWTDTLKIGIQVHQKTLGNILQEIFRNTELHFAIDADKNVYVTHTREVFTDLPVDFFDLASDAPAAAAFDYSDYQQEEQKRKSEESRLYVIGNKSAGLQGTASVAGYVRNLVNGEAVVGASVFIQEPLIGVATDQFGFYSIVLPKGKHELKIQSLEMKPTHRQIMLYSDGKLNIEMSEEVVSLKEVEVKSERDVKVVGLQMGMEKLDVKTLRQTPVALGEADVVKVMLTMPGVQSVGEGASGINVRGGATSQNLILLNDAIIFNPSHLFGFFSAFNADVLKNVELYKSGITADYGGRLSSVMDVTVREGNKKKFSGMGGISPVTGRLTLEGPILKDKASFLIGGRSTYSDWLLHQINSARLKNSTASFYDVNANVNYDITEKDNLYVFAYSSRDRFRLNNDSSYQYRDQNAGIKYKHIFNNKLYGILSSTLSDYQFSLESEKNPVNAFNFSYQIQLWNTKVDFNYFVHPKHTLSFGAGTIHYKLHTGQINPQGEESLVRADEVQPEQGNETAGYVGDHFEVNEKISLYGGLRYSFYAMKGPRTVYTYPEGEPKDVNSVQDTVYFKKGETVANYNGMEPRFSARYLLARNTSMKFSYNRMRQYIHMLSNTIAISPTDIWKLSDSNIKPQIGDQFSVGFYHNVRKSQLELSVEAYIKTMQNFLDYKNGAVLFLNHQIETDVISTHGKAYGAEFLIRKTAGKLNGWLSYTYSRSLLQTRSGFSSETVNRGTYYPANFDKPNALNLVSNYRFSQRLSFSFNMSYSTGRPITIPLAKYELSGSSRLAYSERNQYRIPDYFRIDIGLNIEGNHKVKKLAHGSWSASIYNLTGRNNAYSVYFVSKDGIIKGYQLSIFAKPIPTITYNFKF